MADSNRLRILLTKPSNSIDSANSSTEAKSNSNDHKILKGLLNQQDDEEGRGGDGRAGSRAGRGSLPGPMQVGDLPKPPSGTNKLLEKVSLYLFSE